MKIVKFSAENFMRLKVVEIEPDPDGGIVIVAGRNAQGKSSVLNAIWAALGGAAALKGVTQPVHEGQDEAVVRLEFEDIVVTRTWTAEGKTALKVTTKDGAHYGSPQKMLDGLLGKLSFDPMAFTRMAPKDQLATLLGLVELPFDPVDLAFKRRTLFDARTDINRELKRVDALCSEAVMTLADFEHEHDLEGVEAIDVDALVVEMQAAMDTASANRDKRQQVSILEARHHAVALKVLEAQAALAAATNELAEVANELSSARRAVDGLVDPDVEAARAKLSQATEINQIVSTATQLQRTVAERKQSLLDLRIQSERITQNIEDLDTLKAQALAEANMPVEGLGFDEEGVTFKGLPFAQASSAEQLRVSLAMAFAANPKIRVIRITEGSLLDPENLSVVAEMALAQDAQVWIERVTDDAGEMGVLIEDGEVVS